ncbi:MAG TPA: tail fiber protein [Thermoanaerobaculia bacterium]|jgi:microcystin-dependent protein
MDPYIGEIRIFAGNFPPVGWAVCNGATLSINDYQVLFALIGTTYGGDGQNTFALPDLRGRVPIHQGLQYKIGQQGGVAQVTLTQEQMPAHAHNVLASTAKGASTSPADQVLGTTANPQYVDTTGILPMKDGALAAAGGNQPHENMQPYLAINFIICTQGVYPQAS